jgi:stringent starvation protein B
VTPSRPYLVRAINEWLVDNNLTPHVLVDATRPGVQVPAAYVQDGRIVLNVAPGAVRDLFIRNEALSFSARFGGMPMQVSVPMAAVLAIYARENGQGMFFDEDEDFPPNDSGDDESPSAPDKPTRPALRVVK